MKKIATLLLVFFFMTSLHVSAQGDGAFSSLGAALSIGSTGIDFELVTPIHRMLMLRGGGSALSWRFTRRMDTFSGWRVHGGKNISSGIDVDGKLKFLNSKLLIDFYPFRLPFFLSGGFYWGNKIVATFDAPSDRDLTWDGYILPSENGRVEADVRTKAFKPYLGLGFGRAIPVGLLGFRVELGAMAHGTPDFCDKYGRSLDLPHGESIEDPHTLQKWKIYPVLSFRLTGRLF